MYSLIPFIIFLFSSLLGISQASYKIIQTGNNSDSSYYDILPLSSHEFWIGGKFGILTSIDHQGNIRSIEYPSQKQHLLSMTKLGNSKIIIAADSGTIYFYDIHSLQWEVKELERYKNLSLYHIEAINDSTAFICGGSPIIAYGKRAIPNGFILRTTNGGKTWKEIYKSWNHMIWDIKYDASQNVIFALTYSIFGSKIILSTNRGDSWQTYSRRKSTLYHSFDHQNNSCVMVGGKNGNYSKNGRIGDLANKKMINHYPSTGLLWHTASNSVMNLISGCSCMLYKFAQEGDWKLLTIDRPERLYKIAFIDDTHAYVVGSNKIILQFFLQEITEYNNQ